MALDFIVILMDIRAQSVTSLGSEDHRGHVRRASTLDIMTEEPDRHWWSSRRTDAKAPGAVRLGLWVSLSALSWLIAFCIFRYASTK